MTREGWGGGGRLKFWAQTNIPFFQIQVGTGTHSFWGPSGQHFFERERKEGVKISDKIHLFNRIFRNLIQLLNHYFLFLIYLLFLYLQKLFCLVLLPFVSLSSLASKFCFFNYFFFLLCFLLNITILKEYYSLYLTAELCY